MPGVSFYDILGLAPDASAEDVRAAFRRLSKAVHPDVGGSDVLFRRVKEAYDTLGDPGRRARYDRGLGAGATVVPGAPEEAYIHARVAPTVSLAFSGGLGYTNTGPITTGSIKVEPPQGPVRSATGTVTIPGVMGGTATVAVAIACVFGVAVGAVTVYEPEAHVDTVAVVLAGALRRDVAGQLTGTASGLVGLRPYTLQFTV